MNDHLSDGLMSDQMRRELNNERLRRDLFDFKLGRTMFYLLFALTLCVWLVPAAMANDDAPTVTVDQSNGWYAGGGFGISNGDFTNTRQVPYEFNDYGAVNPERVRTLARRGSVGGHEERPRTKTESYSDDENELAFRLFMGKSDLFTLAERTTFGLELGYANLGDISGNTETDAIDLTATARIDIGKDWAILARAGAAYWDAVDDGTDATGALGVTKTIDALRLRLEWQRYADIDDEDVDAIMLSAAHRF